MNWKAIAIVFIIISLLEFILFGWLISVGAGMLEDEATCANVECFSDRFDAYQYDDTTGICYCYGNGEIIKTIKIE